MSCLVPALRTAGAEVERQLVPTMRGFAGAIVRSYLPQRWVFVTERETANLTVDAAGHCTASEGPLEGPDVTVSTTHDRLRAALLSRDPARVPPGPMEVTAHSAKGRAAVALLRRRLGV